MNLVPMQLFIFWSTTFLANLTGDGNYMVISRIFYQDEDCFLIRGWSKHTAKIKEFMLEGECPPATIAMVPVECIMKPLIAIEDTASGYPHSWLLMKSSKTWVGAFLQQ